MKKLTASFTLFFLMGTCAAFAAETECNDAPATAPLQAFLQFFPKILNVKNQWKTHSHGIQTLDVAIGKGQTPSSGKVLFCQVKTIDSEGNILDDTVEERTPLKFIFGDGTLPAPFEEAIVSMKERGRRLIYYPSDVPHNFDKRPNEYERRFFRHDKTVVYDVTLLWVRNIERKKMKMFR